MKKHLRLNKMMWIVLGEVERVDRKVLENMENQVYTCNQLSDHCCVNKLRLEKMSDFCDLLNNQELDIEKFWVTYVYIEF